MFFFVDSVEYTDMRASDLVQNACNRHNVFLYTEARSWPGRWLLSGVHGMSLFCCIGSEVGCTIDRCYESIEYERYFERSCEAKMDSGFPS